MDQFRMISLKSAAAALFALLYMGPLFAQSMAVPPKLQAAIFQKIFTHDKALAAGNAKVLVVFPDGAPGQKDEVVGAFEGNGIKASAVKLSGLKQAIPGATIVYLMPGVDGSAVAAMCAAHRVLSISGASEQAEEGAVAVAVGAFEGKPKIYVNLKRLKSDAHELSPDILKLAKVIG